MQTNSINIGIVGATGYTGVELLRLLAVHPQARLTVVTSRQEAGRAVADVFPSLRGHLDLSYSQPDANALADCDVVFFATPHGAAMAEVPALLEAGVRVIDISADFRLRDAQQWQDWYGQDHACPELLEEAVYGLPELHRQEIAKARLVACPGCYPTAVILGYLPLMEAKLIDLESLVADAKSGVTGAGRAAKQNLLFGEVTDSFKAYGVAGHRHLPEIRQVLGRVAGSDVPLTFVPHLVPMARGLHATLYARLQDIQTDLQALFERRYADEPFVDVMPAGSHPETRNVRAGNYCQLAVHSLPDADRVIVLSAIDNLGKGAAGQAVQNLNIMFGLPETAGLKFAGVTP